MRGGVRLDLRLGQRALVDAKCRNGAVEVALPIPAEFVVMAAEMQAPAVDRCKYTHGLGNLPAVDVDRIGLVKDDADALPALGQACGCELERSPFQDHFIVARRLVVQPQFQRPWGSCQQLGIGLKSAYHAIHAGERGHRCAHVLTQSRAAAGVAPHFAVDIVVDAAAQGAVVGPASQPGLVQLRMVCRPVMHTRCVCEVACIHIHVKLAGDGECVAIVGGRFFGVVIINLVLAQVIVIDAHMCECALEPVRHLAVSYQTTDVYLGAAAEVELVFVLLASLPFT